MPMTVEPGVNKPSETLLFQINFIFYQLAQNMLIILSIKTR